MALETRIAKAQWSKVENRNVDKTYNKMGLAELAKLAPGFDWPLYFQTIGVKDVKELVVAQPSYLTSMAELLDKVPLATWKVWLKFNIVHRYASLLNKELADADFAFYGTTLRGVPQNRPRWKRGVAVVEGCLGEAVGKLYVEKRFPPEAKQRMDQMVKNVLEAYRVRFQNLDWMSPETKQKALAKLAMFTPKIGYPKKWRDYSALEIRRDDLVGNIERHAIYEWNRDLAKLGKPVDRDEWHMTPQTVNAYYNPSQNEIVFPAAILQPPFFNLAADDAVNYGGIGAVIGHETGHGFDDQGSKWDGAGNLHQWWTPADRAEFDKRGDALAAQFDQFEPFPGFKVNGRFTLGENIGDLAGLTIAYDAYRLSLGGKPAPVIDGLTGDQRFFLGWAQVWRRKHREADLKNRLVTDPHSPAEYRVNGTVRNVPAFYSAFGVKEGDKMYLPPEKRVKILVRAICLLDKGELRPFNQRRNPLHDLLYNRSWRHGDLLHLSSLPVQVLDMVGEDGTGYLQARWKNHLERVAFDLIRDWAEYGQTRLLIIGRRRDHKCRTQAALFVTGLRAELQPDKIAALGHIVASHYQTSRPRGNPVSVSP